MIIKSMDDLFQATRNLINSLENKGCMNIAQELKFRMRFLNGLTDDWVLFLESIDHVQKYYQNCLNSEETSLLAGIHDAVYQAIYRHRYRQKSKPWWKIW